MIIKLLVGLYRLFTHTLEKIMSTNNPTDKSDISNTSDITNQSIKKMSDVKPEEKSKVKNIEWQRDPTRLPKEIAAAAFDLVKKNRAVFEGIERGTPADVIGNKYILNSMLQNAQKTNIPEVADMYLSCERIDRKYSEEGLEALIKNKPVASTSQATTARPFGTGLPQRPEVAQPQPGAATPGTAAPDANTPTIPPH